MNFYFHDLLRVLFVLTLISTYFFGWVSFGVFGVVSILTALNEFHLIKQKENRLEVELEKQQKQLNKLQEEFTQQTLRSIHRGQ